MNSAIEIKVVEAAQTRALRHSVLRPNSPIEETVFPGDDDPTVIHVGALDGAQVIAVASFYREALPDDIALGEAAASHATHVWRLRGMAVAPDRQGQGIGRAVLRFGIARLAREGGALLWCNARTGAVGFYRGAGFDTRGEEFVIPDVGPHFVMVYRIKKNDES